MYIYVANFKNHPNLIKVGKADCPEDRLESLSKTHGALVFHDAFFIGDSVFKVEKAMHRKYKLHCAKDVVVSGDGYTEFFQDSIYDEVCKDLNKYTDGTVYNNEKLKRKIDEERIRCAKLAGRLLGMGRNKLYEGGQYSLPAGWWQLAAINSCIDMGFPKEEVCTKYVTSNNPRFRTTVGRVAIAHSLFTGLVFTNSKIKAMQKLLSD